MKLFYSLAVILLLFANGLFAQTSTKPSGEGTSSTPYQIESLNNLYWITQNSSSWSSYFEQTADIDASNTKKWDSGSGFAGIGTSSKKFIGTYDGNGHTISNLYINRSSSSYYGFFRYTNSATISNLGIIEVNISGEDNIGGLIGEMGQGSKVSDCYVTGNVSGVNYTGGLIGYMYEGSDYVYNCYSSGNVSGNNAIGGLFGIVESNCDSVSYCYSTANVSGYGSVGGLVGEFLLNGINNCYATGEVVADTYDAGGLIGYYNCSNINIKYCYATGAVSASEDAGGLVGECMDYDTIYNCYATGKVTADRYAGGLVGDGKYVTFTSSYYNSETSGQSKGLGNNSSSSVIALTTAQMKNADNFSGWDFTNTWGIQTGKTYPALLDLDNAPFTFADTISGFLSDLLENDYDYETLQENLITKVDSAILIVNGVDYADSINQLGFGDSIKVVYRAGEIRTNDTLYGNAVVSYLKMLNSTPVLFAVSSVYTNEDVSITLSLSNVTASDDDGDELSIVVFAGDNYSFSGTTIYPTENYNGILTVPVAVSDGIVNSDILNMIITVNAVNDAPIIMSAVNTSATVGVLYADTIIAVDIENDDLTYRLSDQPDGMTISNNVITWTPSAGTTTSGTVKLTVSDGTDVTTESFIISVSETSSNIENFTESLNLYPNPVRDNFVIDGFEGTATLYLFDITGNEVLTQIITSGESINTDDFSKGLYVAKIKLTDSFITKSFIKNE